MASQQSSQADSAWQHKRSVSIDISRLQMPIQSQGTKRMETNDGKQIMRFLEALKQRDILGSDGTHGVSHDGTRLTFTVTDTPYIGPQVHQMNIRRIYQQVMGVTLRFEANSPTTRRPSGLSTGGNGGGSSSLGIEVWIEL